MQHVLELLHQIQQRQTGDQFRAQFPWKHSYLGYQCNNEIEKNVLAQQAVGPVEKVFEGN